MLVCKDKNTGKLRYAENGITPEVMQERLIQMGIPLDEVEITEITDEEWADPNAQWNQPSEEALESQAEAQRQELFAEYDHMVDALDNRHRRKNITDAEYDEKLAALDAYAEALRAANDTEGWYKNPQWQPPKPEV